MEGDFERDIVIRKNTPSILEPELPKIREKGFLSIGSGVIDAYQPVEGREELMYKIAGLLSSFSLTVVLFTKSALVERDKDL